MPDYPRPPELGEVAAAVAAAILIDPAHLIDGSLIDASIASRALEAGGNVATIMGKTSVIGSSVALEISGNIASIKTITDALPTFPIDPASNTEVDTRADATHYTSDRASKMDKIQDFLEEGTGTTLADDTEQTISDHSGIGKLHAYVDFNIMASGDVTIVRQFIKIKSGGEYRKYAEETYNGAQTLPLLHVVTKPGKYGVKITLQQSTGISGNAYDWETFVEQAA